MVDLNIQQRCHLFQPIYPSYSEGTTNQAVGYPYVDEDVLAEYVADGMNNYSNSDYVPRMGGGESTMYYVPDGDGMSEWFVDGTGDTQYHDASAYKVPYRYAYSYLMSAISDKFILKDTMYAAYEALVRYGCESLSSQKLLTSQRFAGPMQAATKIKMSSLSAIGRPSYETGTTVDRPEPATSTTTTYTTY